MPAPGVVCRRCGTRLPEGRLPACPRCLLEAELPPAILGDRLELLEEIGRGGMGTVWKARHLRLGRTVAVKFLAEEPERRPELERRFEREAKALARLDHPGIVTVYDFGSEEGRPYIVMEYVEGSPLSEMLPLPPARAREVGLEVLDALAYAHARDVIHRDIKPQNVLIERSGRVKVSDFGIARLLGDEPAGPSLTGTGRLVGTLGYIPPEVLAGSPPDARVDVFAVGVLLHEMLTGRRPAGRVETVPAPLEGVIARAIRPDPAERYTSAADMRAALAAAHLPSAAQTAEALGPEERNWLRAVALVQTLATAAILWAFLLSVTPRVLAPGGVEPLIMLRTETLPDGRVVSVARFETWPTLVAVSTLVLAIVAQALLYRHWRESGLDRPQPERPVRESAAVLVLGAASLAVYLLRRVLAPQGAFWTSYVPIVGGVMELAVVFLAWTAVLQTWRVSRPLRREVRLWAGVGLALIPPIVDLAEYLRAWRP